MSDSRVRERAGKRATNLTLSVDTLEAARELGINVSQVCDTHLRDYVRLEQARRWREQHAGYIEVYNQTLEAEGLPLEDWKGF
jgi:antitoxin CcdA